MEKLTGNNQSDLQTRKGLLAVDKRKHARFNVELPLDYSRTEGEETYGGIVANASEGGVLVYLPERIEVGALLKIEIIYVRGLELDTIKATARVEMTVFVGASPGGPTDSLRTSNDSSLRAATMPP